MTAHPRLLDTDDPMWTVANANREGTFAGYLNKTACWNDPLLDRIRRIRLERLPVICTCVLCDEGLTIRTALKHRCPQP